MSLILLKITYYYINSKRKPIAWIISYFVTHEIVRKRDLSSYLVLSIPLAMSNELPKLLKIL